MQRRSQQSSFVTSDRSHTAAADGNVTHAATGIKIDVKNGHKGSKHASSKLVTRKAKNSSRSLDAKNSSQLTDAKNNSVKSAAGPRRDAGSKSTNLSSKNSSGSMGSKNRTQVSSSKNSSMSSMVKSDMQVAGGSRVKGPSSGLRSNASMGPKPDGPHAKSCWSGRDAVSHGGARKQHVSARAANKPIVAYNEQWLTKSGRSKARAVTGWAGLPLGRRKFDVSRGKFGKLQVTVSVSSGKPMTKVTCEVSGRSGSEPQSVKVSKSQVSHKLTETQTCDMVTESQSACRLEMTSETRPLQLALMPQSQCLSR